MNDFGPSAPVPLDVIDSITSSLDEAKSTRDDMASRMVRVERGLAINTEVTKRIDESTTDLLAAWRDVQGAFKVLEWIGKAAKPLAAIISFGTAALMGWNAWFKK